MAGVEIVNPLPVGEAGPWFRSASRAFVSDPHDDDTRRRVAADERDWQPERNWGARDRGAWVGTLKSLPRTLTVPGETPCGEIGVDAVTLVTVSATHRRRGVMSAMLSASLAAARERGDAISALIAAEWGIYGRFGYAPGTQSVNVTLHSRRCGGVVGAAPGRLRVVEAEELAGLAPTVFEMARRGRAGQMDRRDPWWPRRVGSAGYEALESPRSTWVVHEGAGGPDGLLGWHGTRSFNMEPPLGAIEVEGPFAAGEQAYRDLWGYLADMDGVEEVVSYVRPVDEPLRWMLGDARALQSRGPRDMLWVRLLDVPSALRARDYALPGRLVLDVVDEAPGGYAAGRFALEAGPAGVSCRPTREPAGITLEARALAAAYLGGFRLRWLALAGAAVREEAPGTLHLADLMFSTPLAPWNATWF